MGHFSYVQITRIAWTDSKLSKIYSGMLYKVWLWVVGRTLLYNFKNKSTSNLEYLQHFDVNGIIVHPGMTNNNNLLHPMQDFIKKQNTFITTAATSYCWSYSQLA